MFEITSTVLQAGFRIRYIFFPLGSNDNLEILELLVKNETFKPNHLNLVLHEKLTKMDFDSLLNETKFEKMSLQVYIKVMFRRCKVLHFESPDILPGILPGIFIKTRVYASI